MKNIFKTLLLTAAASFALTACSEDETVPNPYFRLTTVDNTDQAVLEYGASLQYTQELTYWQYAASADAANEILAADRLVVYSNCDWRVEAVNDDQDWVQPFPYEGGSKEGQVFFRVNRNNDQNQDRTAYYKFIINDGSKDIEVGGYVILHQAAAVDFLKTSITKAEISTAKTTQKIRVQANVPWAYTLEPMADYATEDLELWLKDNTVHPVDQLVDTLSFTLPDNSTGSIRGFNVKIVVPNHEDLNVTIPVTQDGAEVELEGFPVSWNGASNSYPSWTAAYPSSGVINSVQGTGTITYVYDQTAAVDRTASKLDVSGSNPRMNGVWPGDYLEFKVPSPVSAQTIIKLVFEARISGSGTRHWRLEYLDGTEWKIAGTPQQATLKDNSIITYTQDMYPGGSADDYNKVISQAVKYANATDEVVFRWYCASNEIASSGEQMTAPTTASARLDYSGAKTGAEPSITCVAAGSEAIEYGQVETDKDVLVFEGTPTGAQSIKVTADKDFSLTTSDSWIKIDKTAAEAYDEITVNVTCDESTLTTTRQGTITVKSGATRKNIVVVQGAGGTDIEEFISIVGGNSMDIDGLPGDFVVDVQSNTEVSYKTDVDWLTVTPEPSTKAITQIQKYSVHKDANTTDDVRTGHVIFYNADKKLESVLTLTQSVFKASMSAAANVTASKAGQSINITIDPSVDYTVSTSDSWITLSKTSGTTDDKQFTITLSGNSDATRAGKITFSNTYYGMTETVNILQFGSQDIFTDDFSWLSSLISEYNEANAATPIGNAVTGYDASVDYAAASAANSPNVYTTEPFKTKLPALLTSHKYEDMNPSGKVVYIQDAYLKFGKTSVHTSIKFSPFEDLSSATNCYLNFDWCAHIQGSGKVDPVTLTVVITGDGEFENGTKYSDPISNNQAEYNSMLWTNSTVKIIGATSETKLNIVYTDALNKDTGEYNWKVSGAHRFHLDNILITK